jgi:two-component system OmpR family sensor kinase
MPASADNTVRFPAASSFYGSDTGGIDASAIRRSTQRVRVAIPDDAGNVLGYVEMSEGPAFGEAIVDNVARGLVIAASAAVLLAGAIGWLVSRRISAPLVELAGATTQMAQGNLSARAEVNRHDEIGALAHAFNEMAAQIETTIHSLRVFVSDAAHELHTPLTALHTDLELAAVDPDPAQRIAHLERALEQMRRFEILTANLLDLSRLDAGIQEERRPVDLRGLMAGLSEVYASRAEQAGSTLQIELPAAPVMVQGYDMALRQAVGNLLDNAIKFTPAGGLVELKLYQDDSRVVVSVKDSGIGIPDEDLPNLFQRFHRGRNAASYPGSGLGLAITQSIIHAHQGTIEAQSGQQGTWFRVLLESL